MEQQKINDLLKLISVMQENERQRQQQQKKGRKKGSYNSNIKEIMEFIQQERTEKPFCCLSVEYLKTFGYNNEQIKEALKHLNLTFFKSVFAYRQLTTKKKKVLITDYTKDKNGKVKVLSEKERHIGILCRLWNFKTFRVITDNKPTATATTTTATETEKPTDNRQKKPLTIQQKIRQDLRQEIRQEIKAEQQKLLTDLATNRLNDFDKWQFFAIR